MSTSKLSLDDLRQAAARKLRGHLSGDGDADDLRLIADYVVEARSRFLTADGSPDWLGRTKAYREWLADVYESVPAGEKARIQASVRWHVGNLVRERLDGEDLDSLGIRESAPREASLGRWHVRGQALAFLNSQNPTDDYDDVHAALTSAARMVRRVRFNRNGWTGEQARQVLLDLADVESAHAEAAGAAEREGLSIG